MDQKGDQHKGGYGKGDIPHYPEKAGQGGLSLFNVQIDGGDFFVCHAFFPHILNIHPLDQLIQGQTEIVAQQDQPLEIRVGLPCGIAWLDGADYQVIAHIIVNSLAILSGMVCDGAKASCAAKIATAVNNGLLGYRLYRDGLQFYGGDGIVTKGVENTIANVGRLAREGMRSTDCEILDIMVGS